MAEKDTGNLKAETTLGELTVRGEGRVISNFALTHFNAAKHFAAEVRRIEEAHKNQPFGNFFEEISIYCSATIISAAASLEALVNELYIAPNTRLHQSIADIEVFFWGSESKMPWWKRICRRRPAGFERRPALVKYKRALKLLNRPTLDRRDESYLNAEALIGFRNYLIHFKPLWDEERRNVRLEEKLQGRFELSPFFDQTSDFVSKQAISAGAADWAVEAVRTFVAEFAERSELDPKKLNAFQTQ